MWSTAPLQQRQGGSGKNARNSPTSADAIIRLAQYSASHMLLLFSLLLACALAAAPAADPSLASPATLALARAFANETFGRPFGLTNFAGYSQRGVAHQGANTTAPAGLLMPLVTRDAIMACAHDWVHKAIPYCQCSGGPASECCGTCFACSVTRCDCSGFVSYCWGLRTGYTTYSLPSISHEIRKDQLMPGDIMLDVSDHVTFFAGWSDSSKTHYVAIQEPGCHTEGPHHAFSSVVPYPFNWNPASFKPYRYNHVE